jgi:hypothetical protein
MATKQVSRYRLIVRSGSAQSYQHNLISLYDSHGAHIANLKFSDVDAPGKTTGNYTTITYPRNVYADAVDMLRNEKPVYFVEDNKIEGGLRTSTSEYTGESE